MAETRTPPYFRRSAIVPMVSALEGFHCMVRFGLLHTQFISRSTVVSCICKNSYSTRKIKVHKNYCYPIGISKWCLTKCTKSTVVHSLKSIGNCAVKLFVMQHLRYLHADLDPWLVEYLCMWLDQLESYRVM